MLRKVLLLGALFSLNAQAFANTEQGHAYTGGNFGFGYSSFSQETILNGLLGYGKNITNKFYLGGEVNAGMKVIRHKWGGRHSSNYMFNTHLGVSAIPGFMINPTLMAYGRIGVQTNGEILGLGLQKQVSEHWSVRGEYTTIGHNFKLNNGGLNFAAVYKLN